MRNDVLSLDVPGSASIGAANKSVADYEQKWVQIGGTFVATMNVEITINGTDWEIVQTLTTKGIVQILPLCTQIRINVTAWTSGAPTAHLMGFNQRTT